MSKGVIFDKQSADRIVRVVRDAEGTSSPRLGTPLVKPRKQDTVAILNQLDVFIPEGGIVWLREQVRGVYGAYMVQYPGITMFGAASSDIAPGTVGSAYVKGEFKVRCESSHETAPLYAKMSVRAKSFEALVTYGDFGAMTIIGREAFPFLVVRMGGHLNGSGLG
jgi:hypothetical protein